MHSGEAFGRGCRLDVTQLCGNMSHLITCRNLSKAFGGQTLFTDISITVSRGDHFGIIGPNGSGKSTLLRILCGLEDVDGGEILKARHVRFSYLAQEDCFDENASAIDNLYQSLIDEPIEESEKYTRVQSFLSRAEFDNCEALVKDLSGGWRKRLAICRAMLMQPDLLVLDEPTNHLDIQGILWLEKLLSGPLAPGAWLLVSHDRRFLENCANRVAEISAVYPEGSLQVTGNYSTFLEEREKFLLGQQEQETRLANKVRREVEWLRRGPKARATKARYRIDEAHRLSGELAEVKSRNRSVSSVQIDFSATGRKTKKLLVAKGIAKEYEGRQLFNSLDLTFSPGSRLGLLGPNGCGKSTIMKILTGATDGKGLLPDAGELKAADALQIVSFDQRRQGLDPELTLRRALAPDGDGVVFRGRSLHVVSWAKKFLFRPDQLETPIGRLSGGEQARIHIAGLMRQEADVLLLDEPTNDLDIDSLDVLENSLDDFSGALVLVTHDRFLLDRLCDSILGFLPGGITRFYADYNQWLQELKQCEEREVEPEKQNTAQKTKKPKGKVAGRLSYMDQRDYDTIEERVAEAEEKVETLQARMESPEVSASPEDLATCWKELELAQVEVESLYERWDELERKKEEGD